MQYDSMIYTKTVWQCSNGSQYLDSENDNIEARKQAGLLIIQHVGKHYILPSKPVLTVASPDDAYGCGEDILQV